MELEQCIKVLLNQFLALLKLSPAEGKIPSVTSQKSLSSALWGKKVYVYWLAMLVFTTLSSQINDWGWGQDVA